MSGTRAERRVLLGASGKSRAALAPLFGGEALSGWAIMEAGSFSQARFVLQHDPCDVLLIHQDLLEDENQQGLAWLLGSRQAPVVFLSRSCAASSARAYELGASLCLADADALAQPRLLARTLERALHWHNLQHDLDLTRERLLHSRRHVDRLVNTLWRMSPAHGDAPWFSQRHMMDRLQEELARARRHQIPLSLAIGEMSEESVEHGALPRWAVEAVIRVKRRSDVAGQYGPNGFLLLMVHTPVEGGLHCVRRLQKVIEHTREALPTPNTPRAYFGLSGTGQERETAASLLRAAEENLDAARTREQERIVAV